MTVPDGALDLIRKYALQNAVLHEGRADSKAILGKVLAERSELRAHARDLTPIIVATVDAVNTLGLERQRTELAALDPALLERRLAEKREGLKPLPGAESVKQIVMRFAPNPNGPATLGHSRGMVIHAEYQRLYKELGRPVRMVLRYDDTDPATKRPVLEAYRSLLEDYRWLGGEPDLVLFASDRIPVYYEYAVKLIALGKAYVCECSQEEFKRLKDAGEPCPHRATPAQQNQGAWNKMLAGGYPPGGAVLRVATDIRHPDPALRDWVAFRILNEPHPRVGSQYRVWPLLDFESAIEDHLQGITHIVRGKDLIDSERKQRFVYDDFGWTYPTTLHWGRVSIHEFGKVSKSLLAEGIKSGKFAGWDDVRLPTLAAMRRRGIRPEAIRNFWVALGLTEKDVAASMENVEAENRKLVEKEANRYFFVEQPQPLKIRRIPSGGVEGHAPLHPDYPQRGRRLVRVGDDDGIGDVLLAEPDFVQLRRDEVFRLKDWGNVRMVGRNEAEYAGNDLQILKQGARIVHWIVAEPGQTVAVQILMPDEEGTVRRGRAEIACRQELGRVVQFERVGFVRLEREEPGFILAAYTHA